MKVIKYLLLVFLLALAGASYAYANIVRLVLIDTSGFRVIESNVYLSDSLAEDSELKVVSLLAEARKRIAKHFGKPNADPVIVVLGNQKEQISYGLNDSPGIFLFAPWGDYLLLNYDKASIDVTAHELVHAEVVNRTGYLKRQFNIPTWFDEGAAMQVDYRPQYTSESVIDQTEFNRLISLETPEKFWSRDKNKNIKNYRAAKLAVSEILKYSEESLYTILAKVQSGEKSVIASVVHETNEVLATDILLPLRSTKSR